MAVQYYSPLTPANTGTRVNHILTTPGLTIVQREQRLTQMVHEAFGIRDDLLAALKIAQELLARNGIVRPEMTAVITKAEG